LLHQERSTPETPLEEVLMSLSPRVLCVVPSLLLLTAAAPAFAKPTDQHSLPSRATARVEHIAVVMLENRSFDHLLGWLPTADARQTALSYPDE
jgi:phospholipase C